MFGPLTYEVPQTLSRINALLLPGRTMLLYSAAGNYSNSKTGKPVTFEKSHAVRLGLGSTLHVTKQSEFPTTEIRTRPPTVRRLVENIIKNSDLHTSANRPRPLTLDADPNHRTAWLKQAWTSTYLLA